MLNEFTVGTITSLLPSRRASAAGSHPTCCKHPDPTQQAPAKLGFDTLLRDTIALVAAFSGAM
jgi:hypothetical protein